MKAIECGANMVEIYDPFLSRGVTGIKEIKSELNIMISNRGCTHISEMVGRAARESKKKKKVRLGDN